MAKAKPKETAENTTKPRTTLTTSAGGVKVLGKEQIPPPELHEALLETGHRPMPGDPVGAPARIPPAPAADDAHQDRHE